jgi:3-methyladenine DNA glycosylase AlkD
MIPMPMKIKEIIDTLKSAGSPENVAGMARYGIFTQKAYGAPSAVLEQLARRIGRNHELAQRLWRTGNHDVRVLAALIEEPGTVTRSQMDRWAKDFDNWAICDCCCTHLFDRTRFAWDKARQWPLHPEEYVKRAGFSMMAVLAVHDKKAADAQFQRLLPLIKAGATDERKYVRKAVNWALRSIGKRNLRLNRAALRTAAEIHGLGSPAARWIASDARRELASAAVQERLKNRARRAKPRRQS